LTGTAATVTAGVLAGGCSSQSSTLGQEALVESAGTADAALNRALTRLVQQPDGPPGAIALVQRGSQKLLHRAGVADLDGKTPIQAADSMRLASVAKAFSGAVALSAAADGALSLSDTVGKRLPNLPRAWSTVTLQDALNHTSGIPDFSKTDAFRQALLKSLLKAPPPQKLLSYAGSRLNFPPGSKYEYSNSDNIVVGLMVQAATGKSYEAELAERVYGPLGLQRTSLPSGTAVPAPLIHGYDLDPPKSPEDVTGVIAAGWSWASGGIVSTPDDAGTFIRAYARGATTSPALHNKQFTFRPGSSEPTGPGQNSAGLAIFRYQTKYGTVYGHTGNTLGYTQFIAATADGSRSAVVSVNAQITPTANQDRFPDLRQIYQLAVGAALASG
jgi:D-alanyl-D-alanine carboxypeptidase